MIFEPVPSLKAETSHFESGDQSMHWISSLAMFFHFQIGACCDARSQTDIVLKSDTDARLLSIFLPIRSSTSDALSIWTKFHTLLEVLCVRLQNSLLLRIEIVDSSNQSFCVASFFGVFWDVLSLRQAIFIP